MVASISDPGWNRRLQLIPLYMWGCGLWLLPSSLLQLYSCSTSHAIVAGKFDYRKYSEVFFWQLALKCWFLH